MKVLIVDDNELYHDYLERLVREILSEATEFFHEYDGENGSLCYERNPDIAVIITDNQMEECDGTLLVQMVREWEQRPGKDVRVPIIMVTSNPRSADVQKALKEGLDMVLEKDVTESVLRDALQKVLLNRR